MKAEQWMQDDAEAVWTETVAALFVEYRSPICAYLYSLVDEWELAHDLTQETFLELFYTRHRLREVENPRAWIYRIATYLALNRVKRRRRFGWLPWHLSERELHFQWHDLDAAVEQRVVVEAALATLTLRYRAPLLLHSYYGFSVREVADLLGLSESNVKVQLHRAREQFRQSYGVAMGQQEDDHAESQ
ncbi:MAG: RNA polymerase sigma factor [Caldilineaceae bacterium]|nr:RNA polymerase sigma factor [Caldilineaceae bacterium]